MRTAKDYPISLPYGSKEPPYGTSALPYHRGDDYSCPPNTPIVVEGVTIGLSGETGYTFGPHLHDQEWRDSVFNTRKPQNAFKGGKVVQADNNVNQQWGKHVTILNKDGWNTTYAHLNEINVKVGQVIKEERMQHLVTRRSLNMLYHFCFNGEKPPKEAYAKYVDKYEFDAAHDELMKSPKYVAYKKKFQDATKVINNQFPGEFK